MNKKILLVLAFVSGFALAMRKSPTAIAKASANAKKLIGQMAPGARNFKTLSGKVETIIKNLSSIGENKIANDLQIALNAKLQVEAQSVAKRGMSSEAIVNAQVREINLLKSGNTLLNNALVAQQAETKILQGYLDDMVVSYANRPKFVVFPNWAIPVYDHMKDYYPKIDDLKRGSTTKENLHN